MTSIVFFGSSTYSLKVLKALLDLPGHNLLEIVTQPDKPFGRDQKVTPNPVAEFARSQGLPLSQPLDFDQAYINHFQSLSPDLALVVAYGPPFFTADMISIPKHGIINIHPSPLPRYRGAAPAPWQIINGETKSAVTFFKIDQLPDHGPLIRQIPFTISPTDTSHNLYQKAFELAANHLRSVLADYLANPNRLTAQDHSQKTYFPKLDKTRAQIDWTQTPVHIERFIRAMQPWPIAWTYVLDQNHNRKKMKVLSAALDPSGQLTLDEVQIEGKKPALWSQIKSYYSLAQS